MSSVSPRDRTQREPYQDYLFEGPDGKASLLDLFDGGRQLIVSHFMFSPDWDEGCSSCSAGADESSDGLLATCTPGIPRWSTSPARRWPRSKRTRRARAGRSPGIPPTEATSTTTSTSRWTSPSRRSSTIESEQPIEGPGLSCFLRDGDSIFHTYSMYARGAESLGGSYYFLDLTALGRQEAWEEPKGRTISAAARFPTSRRECCPTSPSYLTGEVCGSVADVPDRATWARSCHQWHLQVCSRDEQLRR
ncbi:MAG: DUF899 family protein [Pseudonocardiaceae bacterium]